jgi:tetratricopeptide (TPR) repeat protein
MRSVGKGTGTIMSESKVQASSANTLEPFQGQESNRRERSRKSPEVCGWRGFSRAVTWFVLSTTAIAGTVSQKSAELAKSQMEQAYDAAYLLQESGELAKADIEHRRFLAAALRRIANGRASTGDYANAVPIYDEALRLEPGDFGLLKDQFGASIEARDVLRARYVALMAVNLNADSANAHEKAEAHRMLGDAKRDGNDLRAAMEQYKTAAEIDPTFDNLYALANASMTARGKEAAAEIFARILKQYGDDAGTHMNFGRAYALGGFAEDAIREFQRAIELDDRLPGVHYSLGAAYLTSGQVDSARAEAEFHLELMRNPGDTFSYPQLGRIALERRDYPGAEMNLSKAVTLNPQDIDSFIALGEAYAEMGRPAEAGTALRMAISLTFDNSRDDYVIEKAHYQLGRLLKEGGDNAEGNRELEIARALLRERKRRFESKLNGSAVVPVLERTRVAPQREMDDLNSLEERSKPLLAGSYNNLGVHAAMAGNFMMAARYFESAARWQPDLAGIDHNWGRAAFAAGLYGEAVGPLSRFVAANPTDAEARSMLARCQAAVDGAIKFSPGH